MKLLLKLSLFFITISSFSQTGRIQGRIVDEDKITPFPGLNIALMKDSKVMLETQTDYDGHYTFRVPPGTYDLKLYSLGYADKLIPVEVKEDVQIVDTHYPDPCVDRHGVCPYNHTDEIIPIVYGFPSKKMMRQHKRGKIGLGGCLGGCAKWFCKKHNVSF
ncbi:MAG TPA: carboxypeptidase regulatory-like domain-containing protein [Flavobacterium sp.]|nr:carboxypeptidase regulatory-like domain-containing protein [Flavobacterium sp.]